MGKALKKPEKTLLLILFAAVCVIGIYYFAFLSNRIKTEYNNHTADIAQARLIENGDTCDMLVQKPADKIYVPLITDTLDEVKVRIQKGEEQTETVLQFADDLKNPDAVEELEHGVFGNKREMYSELEGLAITVKDIPVRLKITFEYDESKGRLMAGIQNDRLAYDAVKTTGVGNKVFVFVSLVLLAGIVLVYSIDYENTDIVKVYIMLAMLYGLIYLVLFPPGATNDYCTHIVTIYDRANELMGHSDWNNVDGAQGYSLMKEGDAYIIYGMIRGDEKNYSSTNIKKLDESFYTLGQTIYNNNVIKGNYHVSYLNAKAIVYLPYLLVMVLGRILGMNMMIILRLMQIAGFFCYLFLTVKAIRLMPYGREALAVFSLNPIMMQSFVSIGYDIIPIGIMFVAFAYLIRLSIEKDYSIKKWLMLLLFTVLLAFAKGGLYAMMYVAAVFLIIGCQDFKDKIKYLIVAGVVLVAAVIFLKHDTIYNILNARMEGNYAISDVLDRPVEMLRFILYSMIEETDQSIFGAFGKSLSKNESITPWHLIMFNIMVFLAAVFARHDKEENRELNRFEAGAFILVMVLFEIMIFTIFLQDTRQVSFTIDGVQGRYYIPFIPVIIALFRKIKIKYDTEPSTIVRASWLVYAVNILYVMCVYLRR